MDVVLLAIALVLAYLLGAIPSGYLVAHLLAHRDVRAQGSGKTGATNVRRLLGWRGFFLVLFLDALKGAAAVVLARWLVPEPDTWAAALAGIAAVAGHTWPVFLRFRGGRGVAPGGGAMFAMLPEVMLLSTLVGTPTVLLSRYMSLGSVLGTLVVPTVTLILVVFFDRPWPYLLYAIIASALILRTHKDNIERLISGTERRI